PGTVAAPGSTATFTPSAALTLGAVYKATLTTAIKDLAGNSLPVAYSWQFTVASSVDTTPPTVVSTAPATDATGASTSAPITVTFSEPMDPASVTAAFTVSAHNGGAAAAGAVAVSGAVASFTPSPALSYGTLYDASISVAAKDLAGNALAAAYTWSFTTGAQPTLVIDEI